MAAVSSNSRVSVLVNTTAPGAAIVSFAPALLLLTGSSPQALVAVDLNLDGRPDLAVANLAGNSISVYVNTTTAGSTTASFALQPLITVGAQPLDIAASDLNLDGRADLVVSNTGSDDLSLLMNQTAAGAATVSFAPVQSFPVSSLSGIVVAADLNGDGRSDLAVARDSDMAILVNQTPAGAGAASFLSPQPFSQRLLGGPADMNGDGKLDLLVAAPVALGGRVLVNTTTPGAATMSVFASGAFETGSIAVSDFNSDGRPDLGVTDAAFAKVSVRLSTTLMNSQDMPQFSGGSLTPGTLPHAVVARDLNGDGRPDLAVANQNSNDVSVFIASSAAGAPLTFAAAQNFPTAALCVSIVAADFNLDGRLDLATANAGDDSISILLNTTVPGSPNASFAPAQALGTGDFPRFVASDDLNGDGRPDLVSANFLDDSISVLLNTTVPGSPTVSFTARQDFTTPDAPVGLALADFNGDGMVDLASANNGAASASVFLNTTAPGATSMSLAARRDFASGDGPRFVAAGELNGDGRIDLVVANHGAVGSGNTITVLLNTMPPGATIPAFGIRQDYTVGTNPIALALADLNGDGLRDLAVANFGSASVTAMLNTTDPGTAPPTFTATTSFPVGTGPIFVGAGDLDGDGRAELIVPAFEASTVNVLRNQPVIIADATAQGRILNDDVQPGVRFAGSDLTAGEADGTVLIALELTAPSELELSVPFAVMGTATSMIDYTISTSPVFFPAGSTVASISIELLDDELDESDETIVLALGTPANGTTFFNDIPDMSIEGGWIVVGTQLQAVPDYGTVSINEDFVHDLEFGSITSTNGGLPVVVGTTARGLSGAQFAATAGPPGGARRFDFGDLITPELIWVTFEDINRAGENNPWGLKRGFLGARIPVSGGFRYGWVDLAQPSGIRLVIYSVACETSINVPVLAGNLGPGAVKHTLTITDNDPEPQVSFTSAAQSVEEINGTFPVTVALSAVSGRAVTIPFTIGGTATQGADYTLGTTSPLVIAPGSSEAVININLLDDTQPEPDETIVVTLGAPQNATIGPVPVHTFTIVNNDPFPALIQSEFAFLSAPQSLLFTFNTNVSASLTTSDLVLFNQTSNITISPGSMALSYNQATNTARFTFPGLFGQYLFDGNYRARIAAADVTDPSGNPLAEDVVFDFFLLQGDANRDGRVNLLDFNILAANFGLSGGNFSQGNFNYDNAVNLLDFDLLASRFGQALPPHRSAFAYGGAIQRDDLDLMDELLD